MNKKTDENPLGKIKSVAPLVSSGTQLAVTMVVSILIGKYIDDKNNVYPLWTIIFAFLGIAAGLYSFIKTILSFNKKKPVE